MVAATSVPNETEQVRGGARRARRIYASGNIAVEAANVGSIALDILIRPIEADVKILRRQLAATGDWRPGCDSCTSTRAPPLFAARAQCETCFVSVAPSNTTFRGASRARRSTMTLPVMTRPQPPAAHRL